ASLQMSVAPGAIGTGEVGIEIDRLVLIGKRTVEITLVVVGKAATAVGIGRTGGELDRRAVICDRLIEVPEIRLCGPAPAVGPGLVFGRQIRVDQAGTCSNFGLQRSLRLAGAHGLVLLTRAIGARRLFRAGDRGRA